MIGCGFVEQKRVMEEAAVEMVPAVSEHTRRESVCVCGKVEERSDVSRHVVYVGVCFCRKCLISLKPRSST